MTTIIILSVVGILAILAELVLPGGIIGIVGGLSLAAAVVVTFFTYGLTAGLVALVILIVFLFATLGWWMKFFHRLPLTKDLLLHNQVGEDEELEQRQTIVGLRGIAVTDIHPSGRALIEGKRYDVMAEGPEISKDSEVEVVSARGPSIFVRAAER